MISPPAIPTVQDREILFSVEFVIFIDINRYIFIMSINQ